MRLGTGLGLGKAWVPWSPMELPGLKSFWRADSGLSFGTGVSAWTDRAGSVSATQATGSAQPTFVSANASYQHQPTLHYTAASSQVLAAAGFSVSQPDTVYLVGNIATLGSNPEFIDGSTTRQIIGATVHWEWFAGTLLQPGSEDVNPHLFVAVFNGASSAFCVDNTQTPLDTSNPGANALSGILIGGTSGAFLNGDIAEIAICNQAHGASTRKLYAQYVKNRYGIATT